MAQTTKSNTQILQELEALSQSLYQSHTSTTTRQTASLALPRTEIPPFETDKDESTLVNPKPRSRRMSLSPWRSRPKLDANETPENQQNKPKNKWADEAAAYSEKKGIWNWKPIRALTHISMQKLICLFSVEVVAVQGLPASMNGLRLSVCVRKKETKDGAVQTMPSRVADGVADFEETLFIRCHVYFTPGSGMQMKFEPRPFLIYVVAVDADELNFGRSLVDLSGLIQESIEKSFEGTRIKQWDISFNFSGKAKGGELVLKLGFQIMEKDGGIGLYSQVEGQKSAKNRNYSSSFARRLSKTSFSVPSPSLSSRGGMRGPTSDRFQGIDDLNLDEPAYQPSTNLPSRQMDTIMNDNDLPEFDVVEKGVEILDKDRDEEDENSDKRSVSSEVVKEVVQDQLHLRRLSELDSISQQIKALESMMGEEKGVRTDEETKSQILDAEEDKVTKEFLQMLEDSEDRKLKSYNDQNGSSKLENDEDSEEVFVPDLGKGLGCVVQTRNGGFLAAINPTETKVARKETPKLAMQMSKPLVIQTNTTGIELLQKIVSIGLQELTSEILSLMPMDELTGKTAEQIAFEGIASAIIQGRNREGAASTAAKTITAVKSMATAINIGRKERVSSGIWTVSEDPLTVEEILAFSLQKIEDLAIDCLKIQADIAEEVAPFDVSPLDQTTRDNRIMANAVPIEDWIKENGINSETITISLVVQLRDSIRQYEAVGGPLIVLIHANEYDSCRDDEKRYKVASLHVGGIKVRSNLGVKNVWESEKQKLTALQWLVANGMGKGGKKGKRAPSKGPDFVWSFSCRTVADMWLKAIRNPDVKFTR
ncbi:hypothetical protein CDL12_12697 [Handroanthus impetiginosus]|uniref:C2 NT-type domain-containing protein n=1 Tax=Handroanthus impetiginosus TaxID=429701 RepID=A0A2G9HAZ2_9LAMI|nr:hypothetical protein CDL12_12697 [Handroanthus impetiginosus]